MSKTYPTWTRKTTHATRKPSRLDPNTFKLFFGAYKNMTLDEIYAANRTYLDWLIGQDWLNRFTRLMVTRFLSQPDIAAEQSHRFANQDISDLGGKFFADASPIFIPSEQTNPRFNLGKPSWIKIEYGPNRKYPQWVMPEPENNRRRAPGPQEPERDYDPRRRPSQPIDLDRRPPRELSINTRWAQSTADLKRLGRLEEHEIPDATEVLQPIASISEAWRLAASLLDAIERCDSITSLDLEDPRIEELKDWLPRYAMEQIRLAYAEKRDQLTIIDLIDDDERDAAELVLEAIDEQPDLEDIVKTHRPRIYEIIELIRMQRI